MRCSQCGESIRVIEGRCVFCRTYGEARKEFFRSARNQKRRNRWDPMLQLFAVLTLVACVATSINYGGIFSDVSWPAGQIAPFEPSQSDPNRRPWAKDGYLFTPLATYDVKARVLLRSRYRFSPGSDLAPLDLTLGWGPMSDQSLLNRIWLSSGYRSYSFSFNDPSISASEVNDHAANHHLIAKDGAVLEALLKINQGDLVRLSGYLVSISRADGFNWTSSTSRTDSGGGACEVMWVERVDRKAPPR